MPIPTAAELREFLDEVAGGDPPPERGAEAVGPDPERMEDERQALIRALRDAGWNVSRAVRRLGIPRGTLRYRIRQHGLDHLIPRD